MASSRPTVQASGAHGTVRLLVAVLGAPVAWVLHLFTCYALVALECNGGMSDTLFRIALISATALLAGAAALSGRVAHHLLPSKDRSGWPFVAGDVHGRAQFLAGTGLVLSAIFVLLIVLEGLSPLLAPWCAEVLRIAW